MRTSFYRALPGLLAWLLLLLAVPAREVLARDSLPNVIVFFADDLGYGDLGCYGHPFIRTPSLDRFAAQGLRFTDFHAGGPICSPSRAALLTGRAPYRVGVYHLAGGETHLRREEITVAELMKKAGYATFFAGKWHLGRFARHPNPEDHGFDHWFASEGNATPSTRNPENLYRNGKAVGALDGYYCDLVVKESIEWLRRGAAKRPFFIEICSSEPHTPVTPAPKYAAMYDRDDILAKQKSVPHGGIPRPDDVDPTNGKYYYGIVTQLDHAFGILMRALDEMGLAENTLVIFTSDNGPEYPGGSTRRDRGRDRCFGAPGSLRGQKRFLYEGGIRVPGIVRWPRTIEGGAVCDQPSSVVDILPTLCELAGVSVPGDRRIDGVSLVPAFRGERLNRRTPLFWNINFTNCPQMAMRVDDEVLVGRAKSPASGETLKHWIKTSQLENFELYDLRVDVAQRVDVASTRPERFRELVEKMKSLWREVQQEGPSWEGWTGRVKPAERGFDG